MTRDLLVAPLKMLCRGTLLRNPNFDIGKNYKKKKSLLTDGLCFYESNLQ